MITIPIHCENNTCSCKKRKAKVTETGSSIAETILPKPTPVKGNPLFKKIGGNTVPKSESKIPHVYKIEVSNVFIEINSSLIKCKSR